MGGALQLVGRSFGPANLVLGLPLNSPLTLALSNAILQLRGNGVIDQLKRRWVDDLDQCSAADSQARALLLRPTPDLLLCAPAETASLLSHAWRCLVL